MIALNYLITPKKAWRLGGSKKMKILIKPRKLKKKPKKSNHEKKQIKPIKILKKPIGSISVL
jgi:hypothetical protein